MLITIPGRRRYKLEALDPFNEQAFDVCHECHLDSSDSFLMSHRECCDNVTCHKGRDSYATLLCDTCGGDTLSRRTIGMLDNMFYN